jgi:DNA invertase Pin-like site-specific DNA recombinase
MKRHPRPDARVALCYVRKSQVRADKAADQVSPNRQRDLIEALCRARGWTPEWYVDAQGHRSGRTEQREEWQALKARLGDPDVAALVAYDLSRLHRKGHRIGALLDECDQDGIAVVMAAPHQQIDFSTPAGRMMAAIIAMMDEMYAEDVSQRTTVAIGHRKSQGKSVGRPPFGTRRGPEGYLIPSHEGAWILPGGTVVAGTADNSPAAGAVWRGFYDCARTILEMYAAGNRGRKWIANALNAADWRFRDDRGRPVPVTAYDVERVIKSWPEYGGLVLTCPSMLRRSTEPVPALNASRAVFPVELLERVGDVRRRRAVGHVPDRGRPFTSYPYPLAGIVYCAKCYAQPIPDDPGRRVWRKRLGGADIATGKPVYRHIAKSECGVGRRSIPAAVIEAEFAALLSALSVDPALLDSLRQAAHATLANRPEMNSQSFEEERAAAIARCKRRVAAAVTLFADGRMEEQEYRERVEDNERQIAYWQARRSELNQIDIDVESTLTAVSNLHRLWDIATDEDRQALVRALFDELVVDLDRQEITGFRVKPWAETYLIARASVLVQDSLHERKNHSLSTPSTWFVLSLDEAEQRILDQARIHHVPCPPVRPDFTARNAAIQAAYASGVPSATLVRMFRLSRQRIHQIVNVGNH